MPKDGTSYYFRAQMYKKLKKSNLAQQDLDSAQKLDYKDNGYFNRYTTKLDSGPLPYED